jgi:hypothetical protein
MIPRCARPLAAATASIAVVIAGTPQLSLAQSQSAGPQPDRSQPPTVIADAGPFTARRLSSRPVIDGREWIATEAQPTYEPGPVPLSTDAFTLTAVDCGDHDGDFTRCRLYFGRDGRPTLRIAELTAWVFVMPDARYVITEPLDVLDVREWKLYQLSEPLQIRNYTRIEAISHDGRRLFLTRRNCGMDCRNEEDELFELHLP